MITTDHELKIISEISKNATASQRELSKVLNLSLGMVNIVLHKLVQKGLMKVQHLNGRNVQYILTPKGASEKTKKARQYLQRTIDVYTKMKDILKGKMRQLSKEGIVKFYVFGDWEFIHIFDLAVKELRDVEGLNISCAHIRSFSQEYGKDCAVFLADDPGIKLNKDKAMTIDLADLLSEKLV